MCFPNPLSISPYLGLLLTPPFLGECLGKGDRSATRGGSLGEVTFDLGLNRMGASTIPAGLIGCTSREEWGRRVPRWERLSGNWGVPYPGGPWPRPSSLDWELLQVIGNLFLASQATS